MSIDLCGFPNSPNYHQQLQYMGEEIRRIGKLGCFAVIIDEDIPDNEALLKFPEGQEHKNIRIVNIGVEEGVA